MTAGAAPALASAAAYGISDFAGGLLARRIDLRVVAVLGQAGGLVVALATTPLFPSQWDGESMLWGAVSGVGTGIGMLFLAARARSRTPGALCPSAYSPGSISHSSASSSGRRIVNSVSALRISSSRPKYTPHACSAMIP